MKKLTQEKEALECQLKNEKDEKELYKVMPLAHYLTHVPVGFPGARNGVHAFYARGVKYPSNCT